MMRIFSTQIDNGLDLVRTKKSRKESDVGLGGASRLATPYPVKIVSEIQEHCCFGATSHGILSRPAGANHIMHPL
jgi:hypothetical protein